MNIDWYFSDELSPSDELVDKFADSKFGIDRWSSFAREIIQNSLDAQDDETKPVEVIFDLNKELCISDIPGCNRTKEILEKCIDAATNKQTKGSYKVGLDVLNKEKIYCLKISDKNTKGVRTGREEAWGALVFDEGKSIKQRPGSAGSHGVGKKVPFIISSCNTVFYATKNKYIVDDNECSDCLLQGKTTLISWTDNDGKRKNSKGWYGLIDEEADTKNRVNPIVATNNNNINPYFIRTADYGTDVIIVGVNIYNNESDVTVSIISAVLENFFVAILNENLVVKVFDEVINKASFEKMFRKYYRTQSETKNGLEGCLRVYQGEVDKSQDIYDMNGNCLGRIDIYFGLGNEHNKKYYTIVRSHGMRITDYRLNKAGQPYTAVVYIDGKELNELLASLENAAHDSFVTKDENMEINKEAVYALEQIKNVVSEFILERTSVDEKEGQTIDGLSNIITIPGVIASVKKKNFLPVVKRTGVSTKGKGSKSKDYTEGKAGYGETNKKKKRQQGKNKPAKKGGQLDSVLYEDFLVEPVFIKGNKEYLLKFAVNENINNAELKFMSVNSEGKEDDTVCDILSSVNIGNTRRKVVNGKVNNVSFKQGEINTVTLNLNRDITYQLSTELYKKGDVANE